jgi:Zn-dependent protease
MSGTTLIQEIIIWALPILFAVTVHEAAHGYVANRCGDKTALLLGRLTLNPLKHIDLMGTIIVPLSCLALGGFIFGWAKPVPVTWSRLENPRRDMALVALAGPLVNLLMALIWAALAKIALAFTGSSDLQLIVKMGQAGITINLVLMLLNLLPIPPLDGSRVISSILPPRLAFLYDKIEPYGLIIIIILIVTKILSQILQPPLMWLQKLIENIFGL